MRQHRAILISGIILLGLCTSCGSRGAESTANAQAQVNETATANSADANSADIVAQSAQAPAANPPQDFSPSATSRQSSRQDTNDSATQTDGATTSVYGQSYTCETANYVIELLNSGTQPSMVVRRRNGSLVANSPADVLREKDDSLVFTSLRGESTYYVTVNPSTNTCNLQVVGPNGSTIVNESGQLVSSGGANDTDLDAYRLGYQQGFQAGYESGFNYRKYKYGYYPDSAYRSPSYKEADYAKGYRDGFYAGFHQGYYSVVEGGMW